MYMDNKQNKDVTITILIKRYKREENMNETLKLELASKEFEIDKLRKIAGLTSDDAFFNTLYEDIAIKE